MSPTLTQTLPAGWAVTAAEERMSAVEQQNIGMNNNATRMTYRVTNAQGQQVAADYTPEIALTAALGIYQASFRDYSEPM